MQIQINVFQTITFEIRHNLFPCNTIGEIKNQIMEEGHIEVKCTTSLLFSWINTKKTDYFSN